ncbi:MAG: hypothetical protein KA436_10095 [Oligoflexales bacterium]|nr:hypothetical protein [Oligoflexales bacterium]
MKPTDRHIKKRPDNEVAHVRAYRWAQGYLSSSERLNSLRMLLFSFLNPEKNNSKTGTLSPSREVQVPTHWGTKSKYEVSTREGNLRRSEELQEANLWEAFSSPYYKDFEKVKIFKELFSQLARRREKSLYRESLNEWLGSPKEAVSYFGQKPELWEEVCQTLLRYKDLEDVLPQFWSLFEYFAFAYPSFDLDEVIWKGFLDTRIPRQEGGNGDSFSLWRGVAFLHSFLSSKGHDISLLWKSRKILLEQNKDHERHITWQAMQDWALFFVKESLHFHQDERNKMLRLLRMASNPGDITLQDLEDGLSRFGMPQEVCVRQELWQLLRHYKLLDLEFQLLKQQISKGGAQTNQDVFRLMNLAFFKKDFDLGWRSASVLHSRRVLSPDLVELWKCSGEFQKIPLLFKPSLFEISKVCYLGFSSEESSLLESIIKVGPLLFAQNPEYKQYSQSRFKAKVLPFLTLSSNYSSQKSDKSSSPDQRLLQTLQKKPTWLGSTQTLDLYESPAVLLEDHSDSERGRYVQGFPPSSQESKDRVRLNDLSFLKNLPDNDWATTWKVLSYALSFEPFGWKLSLMHKISELCFVELNQQNRGKGARVPVKSSFLSQLSLEEKMAWYKFRSVSPKITEDQAVRLFLCFVTRLSTLTLQNHSLAFATLQSVGAPLFLLRDLESWTLSDEYGFLRKKMGSASCLNYFVDL